MSHCGKSFSWNNCGIHGSSLTLFLSISWFKLYKRYLCSPHTRASLLRSTFLKCLLTLCFIQGCPSDPADNEVELTTAPSLNHTTHWGQQVIFLRALLFVFQHNPRHGVSFGCLVNLMTMFLLNRYFYYILLLAHGTALCWWVN